MVESNLQIHAITASGPLWKFWENEIYAELKQIDVLLKIQFE